MTIRTAIVLSGIAVSAWLAPALARSADGPATAPSPRPATQPDPAAVQSLVARLSDANAAVRDEASRKLEAMGKSVLPDLKELADAQDPELRARAKAIARRLERRPVPAAPQPDARSSSTTMRTVNGYRTIDVKEGGRTIHVEQTPAGVIKMTVTGVDEAGQPATETFDAKDADELKRDNPEAHALYERATSGQNRIRINVRGAGRVDLQPNPVAPAPGGGGGTPAANAEADPFGDVRGLIREQVRVGNLPPTTAPAGRAE